jgi:hypothetical protein
MFLKKLLDLISRNIDVGQVAQHLFLRYWVNMYASNSLLMGFCLFFLSSFQGGVR